MQGAGNLTGTITLTAGALEGDEYVLDGAEPLERTTDFPGFRSIPNNAINLALDAMEKQLQEMRRDVNRASLGGDPFGETYDAGGLRISNVADAEEAQDAVNKSQLDAAALGGA